MRHQCCACGALLRYQFAAVWYSILLLFFVSRSEPACHPERRRREGPAFLGAPRREGPAFLGAPPARRAGPERSEGPAFGRAYDPKAGPSLRAPAARFAQDDNRMGALEQKKKKSVWRSGFPEPTILP